jgi:hypothetical protein
MKSVPFDAAIPAQDTKGPVAAVFANRSSWRTRSALFLFCCYGIINQNTSYTPVPTGSATVDGSFFGRFNLYARRFFLNSKGTPPHPS